MIFNFDCVTGQHHHFCVRNAVTFALIFRGFNIFGILNSDIVQVQLVGKNHFELFFTKTTFQDCTVPFIIGRFMDIEAVRLNRTLHHIFSQAAGPIDKDDIPEACFGI